MSLRRPCLDCGKLGRWRTRCPRCEAMRERAKAARRPEYKTAAETRRRREAVAEHRARFGDWCPGFHERPGRPAHPSADLTADHVVEVSRGGSEGGPLVVRCRSCNSARAAAILAREVGFPMRATAASPRQPNGRLHRDGDDPGPVAA
jgi:hypothetical protein